MDGDKGAIEKGRPLLPYHSLYEYGMGHKLGKTLPLLLFHMSKKENTTPTNVWSYMYDKYNIWNTFRKVWEILLNTYLREFLDKKLRGKGKPIFMISISMDYMTLFLDIYNGSGDPRKWSTNFSIEMGHPKENSHYISPECYTYLLHYDIIIP